MAKKIATHGNAVTMNLNTMLYGAIRDSQYFRDIGERLVECSEVCMG